MVKFTTEEMEVLNQRYSESLEEVWRFSNEELDKVMSTILQPESMSSLHRLCDSIAILDCITSFVTHISLRCASCIAPPKFFQAHPEHVSAVPATATCVQVSRPTGRWLSTKGGTPFSTVSSLLTSRTTHSCRTSQTCTS
mmetsp:Transcript_7669/g.18951  ORF Transcript_7669/g.18951 Transcript_7669/m.18951 type:complete len:140 (+) Transcript_7669:1455-1874(+)